MHTMLHCRQCKQLTVTSHHLLQWLSTQITQLIHILRSVAVKIKAMYGGLITATHVHKPQWTTLFQVCFCNSRTESIMHRQVIKSKQWNSMTQKFQPDVVRTNN